MSSPASLDLTNKFSYFYSLRGEELEGVRKRHKLDIKRNEFRITSSCHICFNFIFLKLVVRFLFFIYLLNIIICVCVSHLSQSLFWSLTQSDLILFGSYSPLFCAFHTLLSVWNIFVLVLCSKCKFFEEWNYFFNPRHLVEHSLACCMR